MSKEELQKRAQEKLAQARTLISEAGDLAREGQFYLSFGEVGVFIPKNYEQSFREDALETLKKEGRYNGYEKTTNAARSLQVGYTVYNYRDKPRTPFDQLTADEVECAVDEMASDWAKDEIGNDNLEYATRDRWWHPSRC